MLTFSSSQIDHHLQHHLIANNKCQFKYLLTLLLLTLIAKPYKCQQQFQHQQMVSKSAESLQMFRPSPVFQGPGVDLVGLNRRRFELEHNHEGAKTDHNELERAQLIESNLAALPEQLLSNLPTDLNQQLMSALATDSTLGVSLSTDSSLSSEENSEDPDSASIERLTKSCLTVHASSARPEQLNVTFHLYTRNNPINPFILRPQLTRLELIKHSPFDPNKPVKWVTHGFHTNVDKSEWMVEMKNKILSFEDANVILTDWRRGASPALAFYPKAAANAHVVAKLIVNILRRLRDDLDFSQVHLIGHSLGAHIMGFVGSAFTEEFLHQRQQSLASAPDQVQFWRQSTLRLQPGEQQLIGRITACDPALPCFGPSSSAPNSHGQTPAGPAHSVPTTTAGYGPTEASGEADWTPSMWTHLRPDSAVLVEVMHSNPGVMGYADPLGDYDFYPNGFERQPGCGQNSQADSSRADHLSARSTSSRSMRGFIGHLMGSLSGSKARAGQQQQQSRISQTIDKFIKPIRDFFRGYTCSHHRSVEYLVESLYYQRVPQQRRLDTQFVCQMVGYRCSDYLSFKRGFCFRCDSELDCRSIAMSSTLLGPSSDFGHSPSLASQFGVVSSRSMSELAKFGLNSTGARNESRISKRVLPTMNHHEQNYLSPKKNQYFFDTRPVRDFCLHHYHLLVKFRWFRVRDGIAVDAFRLLGTLATIEQLNQVSLNRFTHQSYTLLLTHSSFLGQIDQLLMFGDKLKPTLVEYIEVSYLSNLDPRIRALGSARLCRQQTRDEQLIDPTDHKQTTQVSLFVRCSGKLV